MNKYIFLLATTLVLLMMITFSGSAQQAAVEDSSATGFLEQGKTYHFYSVDGGVNHLNVEDDRGGNWVKVKIRSGSGWINLDNVTMIAPAK